MKLALLGGTGPSGRALIAEALGRGDEITIFARTPSKLDSNLRSNSHVTIVEGTLDDEAALGRAIAGNYAVLSFLSPNPGQATDHLLTDAFRRIFRVMKTQGVTRFVGTGTPSYDHPNDGFSLILRFAILLIRIILPKVYRDVRGYSAVVLHAEQVIEWSWFRVMYITNKPKTKKVLCGYMSDGKMSFGAVRREDLASTMLDEVTERRWVKEMPVIRSG
jgi:nucleoside-diphosphate-sugar epimerase